MQQGAVNWMLGQHRADDDLAVSDYDLAVVPGHIALLVAHYPHVRVGDVRPRLGAGLVGAGLMAGAAAAAVFPAAAAARKQRDQGYQPDLDQWTNGGDGNSGVPAAAFGPPGMFSEDPHRWRHLGRRKGYPPIRDFRPSVGPGTGGADTKGADQAEDPGEQDGRGKAETPRFERRPQLMVLSTTRDRPLDWLRAGQALQHALLTATHNGVSASFLTQPLELHDAQSLRGRPPESPESPGPGARPRPLELLGRKADSDLQPLPGGGCDSDRRRLPWRWPYAEYPQMVLRVGYAAHDAVITARQDPVVLDSRTGRWMRRSRPILAAA
jgi:hypothetical protein